MRRFYLQRNQDASGVSGLGKVAEGCQFDNGWCALEWITSADPDDEVHGFYHSIERIDEIHGHGGMTKVVWIDDDSSNVVIQAPPSHCICMVDRAGACSRCGVAARVRGGNGLDAGKVEYKWATCWTTQVPPCELVV